MSTFHLEVRASNDDLEEILEFLKDSYEDGDDECGLLLKCYKKNESNSNCLIFHSSRKKDFLETNPERLIEIIVENFPSTECYGTFDEDNCNYEYQSAMGESDVCTNIKNDYYEE